MIKWLFKIIISSRFSDIYIFSFIGIIVGALDIAFKHLFGMPFFYIYVGSRGFIALILAFLFVAILVPFGLTVIKELSTSFISTFIMTIKENDNVIEFTNKNIIDYLKTQNIYLRPDEKIYISAINSWKLYKRAVVLTNQRIFQYEFEHIIQQVYLQDIDKLYYEKGKTGPAKITIQSRDGNTYNFSIFAQYSLNIIDKLKEILKGKVYKKG